MDHVLDFGCLAHLGHNFDFIVIFLKKISILKSGLLIFTINGLDEPNTLFSFQSQTGDPLTQRIKYFTRVLYIFIGYEINFSWNIEIASLTSAF